MRLATPGKGPRTYWFSKYFWCSHYLHRNRYLWFRPGTVQDLDFLVFFDYWLLTTIWEGKFRDLGLSSNLPVRLRSKQSSNYFRHSDSPNAIAAFIGNHRVGVADGEARSEWHQFKRKPNRLLLRLFAIVLTGNRSPILFVEESVVFELQMMSFLQRIKISQQ